MTKFIDSIHAFECQIFRFINSHFEQKILNMYFRSVTHLGGATYTIMACLFFIVFMKDPFQLAGIASGIALLLSHIPVAIIKKFYPRKRPYLSISDVNIPKNPLQDYSFPSGHTTAIFSITIPFMVLFPYTILFLLPLAMSIGLSRVFLGLHYPSDVLAGCVLGTTVGLVSVRVIEGLI
ncbi:phosphatase PAP2 family protein [Bacillus carboniphilus]|uniref:Phosphatase PAP2 family protein n=1 Tax=Bacillus carboniphilus TaxID=86663 RepID=A0ABY9JU15_9BACI|nr:phosphatase PAP2 family protein [Bacillus carboniphilus]WLR41176.1 phosphatase PAP2 family protein [Bacillus carboniphilus]